MIVSSLPKFLSITIRPIGVKVLVDKGCLLENKVVCSSFAKIKHKSSNESPKKNENRNS
jgi:hypothetical protein